MGIVFNMINPTQISTLIERMVSTRNMTYMDAVLELCEDEGVDAHLISKHLSKPIIENIEREARDVNLLPKKKSLPFS
jgi:hypothetical protein